MKVNLTELAFGPEWTCGRGIFLSMYDVRLSNFNIHV